MISCRREGEHGNIESSSLQPFINPQRPCPSDGGELLTLTAQSQPGFSHNRRYAVRRPLRLATILGDCESDATIHDLSVTGMLLETAEEVAVGDLFLVEIPHIGHVPATVVWNSGRFFGCKFDQPISAAAVSGALLRNPFVRPHSALGAAHDQICTNSSPLTVKEAGSEELPLPTRLVVLLVMAVAACAPVAVIAALFV